VVGIGEDHEDLLSSASIPFTFCREGQSRSKQALSGHTWLNNHIEDWDYVLVIEAFQDLDLANGRHGHLRGSDGIVRKEGGRHTPSRTLCMMSFFSATTRFVTTSTPLVTTLFND